MLSVIRRFALIVVPVVLLSACVNNAPQPSLARGKSISVIPPLVRHLDVTVDSKAKRVGKGAALGVVGVIGGAGIGGLCGAIIGLACGPGAIVCSPLFAAAGIGIGGVGGGAMGAAYGGRGGISAVKTKAFNEATTRVFDKPSLEIQLSNQFVEQASNYWTIKSDTPNTVAISIKSLRFEQTPGELIKLVIHAEMKVQLAGITRKFQYNHSSETKNVDDWLADDGKSLQVELDVAIQKLTHRMVGQLVAAS